MHACMTWHDMTWGQDMTWHDMTWLIMLQQSHQPTCTHHANSCTSTVTWQHRLELLSNTSNFPLTALCLQVSVELSSRVIGILAFKRFSISLKCIFSKTMVLSLQVQFHILNKVGIMLGSTASKKSSAWHAEKFNLLILHTMHVLCKYLMCIQL